MCDECTLFKKIFTILCNCVYKIKNFTFFGNYDNIDLVLNKLYKSFENQIFKIRACSSVDRAVVSGTMCGGSIPFRCVARGNGSASVRCITGVIRIGNCQKSYGGSERSKR